MAQGNALWADPAADRGRLLRQCGGANVFVYETASAPRPLGIVALNEWVHLSVFVAPRSSEGDLPRVTVKAGTFELRDFVLRPQVLPIVFSADVGLYTERGRFRANVDNVTMDWN